MQVTVAMLSQIGFLQAACLMKKKNTHDQDLGLNATAIPLSQCPR